MTGTSGVIRAGELPASSAAAPGLARFGSFELSCHAGGELRRGGVRIKLQELPLRLLTVLLEAAGAVVTRDELRQRLWPADTYVDFDHSLNTAIRKLRTALDDSAETPRFIETVARHGYRFIAPVEWVIPAASAAPPRRASPHLRRRVWIAAAAIALLLAAGAMLYRSRSTFAPTPIRAVAVLPVANSDKTLEYLSDGLTEVLINSLSELRDLRVMARTTVFHFKGKPLDPKRIGRDLDVPAVIVGTLQQSANQIRIQVELIDVSDGAQIWGKQYSGGRTALVALQRQIIDDVTRQLRPGLTESERPRLAYTVATNADAYDLYLKGLHAWNKRGKKDLLLAIDYFNRALALDPQFVLGYAGLANAYGVMVGNGHIAPAEGQVKAAAAAEKALSHDATLAEAWTSRAAAKSNYHRDFAGAERDFRRAVELNPSYATGHQWYAGHLWNMGRFAEARREIELAYKLDPLSPPINWDFCHTYYLERRFEEAIACSRRAEELDPRFYSLGTVTFSFVAQNKYDELISELTRPNSSVSRDHANAIAAAFKADGPRGFHEKQLELQMKRRAAGEYVSPVRIARLYARLGQADEAFRWLDLAYQERSSALTSFYTSPAFDSIRSDPRFDQLARRIGMPQVR
jgi:TolB-like protein/DNA-binding winged helix-turn-helix (wHTH) protein/Flp pilus assembly protein TadD